MKKRIFASMLGLMLVGGMFAETTQTLLINGENVDKVVNSITFEEDKVILHFGTETESYDMNIVSLALEYKAGINDLKMYNFNGKIEGGILSVEGLKANVPVIIYDLTGTIERTVTTDANGNAMIDIETLPAGVYIMRSEPTCIKFVKR